MPHINVIGAGLAGCEAAYQASLRGVCVTLYEMKPGKKTPAHKSDNFGELVCSNSLRSDCRDNAAGLLKCEMSLFGSLIMQAAENSRVPAGTALAVDRDGFSSYISDKIRNDPNITVVEKEILSLPDNDVTVIATGPLTSRGFSDYIIKEFAGECLHFFDAAAPIIDASSINRDIVFKANRYGKGDGGYLNCPMNKEQFDIFRDALVSAETAKLHDFDGEEQKDLTVFEGCMPVEVMASRGYETLLFGTMKPVGLPVPSTGKDAYAIVQLRSENVAETMYNLVGFQTHLTFPEQRRVFRLIPGLENAEFIRYGVMHRNTYLNSPELLLCDYSLRSNRNIFFAGQMTGVEGYIESAGSGLVAGVCAAMRAKGLETPVFPTECELGAMANYVSHGLMSSFQPMNANFGIIKPLDYKVKGGKKARNSEYAVRSLKCIEEFKERI